MRETNQPYLMICRILVLLYVPLSLLLCVSLLFTLHLVRSFFALLTIPFLFLFPLLERFLYWKCSYRFNLLYFVTLAFWYSGSYVLHLDNWIPHYTFFGHVVLACFLVLLGLVFPCRVAASRPPQEYSRLWFAFGALFSIVCNTIVILIEAVLALLLGGIAVSLRIVLFELAIALFSAILFAAALQRFGERKGLAFLLSAVQELAMRNRKPQPSTMTITSVEAVK